MATPKKVNYSCNAFSRDEEINFPKHVLVKSNAVIPDESTTVKDNTIKVHDGHNASAVMKKLDDEESHHALKKDTGLASLQVMTVNNESVTMRCKENRGRRKLTLCAMVPGSSRYANEIFKSQSVIVNGSEPPKEKNRTRRCSLPANFSNAKITGENTHRDRIQIDNGSRREFLGEASIQILKEMDQRTTNINERLLKLCDETSRVFAKMPEKPIEAKPETKSRFYFPQFLRKRTV